MEKEKASTEDVRKQAMERKAKRKGDDEENREKKSKIRRSTADAIDYLREKSEIRKREIQLQAEKQDQTQRQQQAMFSAMMAQIQQQHQNMMSLMKTLMENYKKA